MLFDWDPPQIKNRSHAIRAIVACDERGGISKDGSMPWGRNPVDLSWFKEHTIGQFVIMGRNTWDDPNMPSPLPNRTNVVITNRDCPGADITISGDVKIKIPAIPFNLILDNKWSIGGAKLIEQCIPIIDELYLTRIRGDFECDTFLPMEEIDERFTQTELIYGDENTEFEILTKNYWIEGKS